MEAITYGIVAGVFFLLDRFREKRVEEEKARIALALPEPPKFTLAQIMKFTRHDGPVRVFDKDVTDKIVADLASRSVIPVTSDPFLAQAGKVWRVVPLTDGAPRAIDVVMQAHADKDKGVVVLGSLSLILLPTGSTAPMVIVVGGPNSQILAVREDAQQPGGKFALLRPSVAASQTEATAPASAKPAQSAGAPAPAPVSPTPPFPPTSVSLQQAAELGRIVASLRDHERQPPALREDQKVPLSSGANGIKKDEAAILVEAEVVPSQE